MKTKPNNNIKLFLTKYLKPKIWLIILIIICIIISQALTNASPYLYKLIVDKLTIFMGGGMMQNILVNNLVKLIALVLITGILSAVFVAVRTFIINRFEAETMRKISSDFVKHVLGLSYSYHTKRKTGKFAKQFARGTKAVESLLDSMVFNLIPNIFTLLMILVMYFLFDWQSGLILLGTIIVYITATIYLINWQQKFRKAANDLEDQSNRKAIDAFMNVEAVKYFAQENHESGIFDRLNRKWKAAEIKYADKYVIINFIQEMIGVFGAIGIVIFSIIRVVDLTFTIGSLVMMIAYLARVYFPLFSFQWVYRNLRTSMTDLDSIMAYFQKENEIKDISNAQDLKIKEGKIEFKNISFTYENGREALKNVSFTVPAGKSVALVGPSGVGKSTLVKLLYRFYDLKTGQILVDDQDISQIKQDSLRKNMVLVPQETALFNETIKYNIAYGKPDANETQIGNAAKSSKIFEFVQSLKDKYNTLVGERGIRLSGGEKQRVSIARAILNEAPILVLDEATSSLDSATEKDIQDSLEKLMKNRTTVIIAHRLSTVMKADHIVVLENGSVIQSGTHGELLKKGGLYQKLWKLQAGGYIK